MAKNTPIGKLTAEVEKALAEYEKDIVAKTDSIVEETAAYAVKELKRSSPGQRRRGSYATGWTKSKPTRRSRGVGVMSVTVYNSNKPSLTHILDSGTAERVQKTTGRRTGRVTGDHHIERAEERVEHELDRRLEDLKNG